MSIYDTISPFMILQYIKVLTQYHLSTLRISIPLSASVDSIFSGEIYYKICPQLDTVQLYSYLFSKLLADPAAVTVVPWSVKILVMVLPLIPLFVKPLSLTEQNLQHCNCQNICKGVNQYSGSVFRGMDTFSGETTLSTFFCLLFKKGFTLKGKNLLPLGANSLLLEWNPFQKGFSS